MDFSIYLDECIKAAQLAAEEILDVYRSGDFNVQTKSDNSPVTRADKAASKIITGILSERFPEAAILCEEEADNPERRKNDLCFIVDPLDGTIEFVNKTDMFTVNIGLAYKQKSVLGVIVIPMTGETYYACEGLGAFYIPKGGKAEQIHVSDRTGTENLRLVRSNSAKSEKLDKVIRLNGITDVSKVGSSIKGCLIAHGKADVYCRFGLTSEWDTCAMQCIAEQAGGVFFQLDGTPMLYNREDTLNRKGFYILNSIKNKLEIPDDLD